MEDHPQQIVVDARWGETTFRFKEEHFHFKWQVSSYSSSCSFSSFSYPDYELHRLHCQNLTQPHRC